MEKSREKELIDSKTPFLFFGYSLTLLFSLRFFVTVENQKRKTVVAVINAVIFLHQMTVDLNSGQLISLLNLEKKLKK